MKKFLIGLLVSSAFVGTISTALAADLDPGAPPPPTDDLRPASYDWSGLYVGASLGGNCGAGKILAGPDSYHVEDCAKSFGIFTGYNHQVDSMVFGIEGNWDFNHGYMADHDDLTAQGIRFKMPMTAGIKGRVGYAIDNTLLYGSAGYVYGQAGLDRYALVPAGWVGEVDKSHHGLTLGMGVEHALTDVIRIRADYEYAMYGKTKIATGCCTSSDMNTHTLKIGASYAFSTIGY